MEEKVVSKLGTVQESDVSVTIRVGEHSMDTKPLHAMEKALAQVFRLGGIRGEVSVKLGPYIQQAKKHGIRVISIDARSVVISVQLPEYHRFNYKLYVDRPPNVSSNIEFAALIEKGIHKLEKLQRRPPRRRNLGKLVEEARLSVLPKIEADSTPVSEDSTEEITEQGIQLAQLREEHEKDVALLHQTETELSEVKQQIEFEKTRIPRDQEVLHLLNVRKSRLISALPPIRRRLHVQEVEIPRLERVLHLDRTREQRFAEAAAQVRAILTHDELPAFLDQLRGL